MDFTNMTLAQIASEIRKDWAKPYFGAVPYLNSLASLDTMKDEGFGFDMPNEQILYFLSNASSWRGETARTVKAELKRRMK